MAYKTLLPGLGHFYTAPVGTPAPSDPTNPGSAWKDVGNTPIDDILTFDSDGGEETLISTLQNKRHRVSRSDLVESFAMALHDFTKDSYELYYGTNMDTSGVPGWYGPNADAPTPFSGAFLGVLVDGDSYFPIYVPKAEIYRAEGISLSGTEDLATLPIKVTPLSVEGKQPYYVKPITETTKAPVGGTGG